MSQACDPDTVNIANLLPPVGVSRDRIVLLGPAARDYSRAEALVFAAWLVALADDPSEPAFGRILRRVLGT